MPIPISVRDQVVKGNRFGRTSYEAGILNFHDSFTGKATKIPHLPLSGQCWELQRMQRTEHSPPHRVLAMQQRQTLTKQKSAQKSFRVWVRARSPDS